LLTEADEGLQVRPGHIERARGLYRDRAALEIGVFIIAYGAKTGLFYLTGKLWKTIFTGCFTETSR
jgi:hypothetical protein